jgi:MoaA/NifB/PqqE/SkfB family radical SAM enzyme
MASLEIERISLELSNVCQKACSFCYSVSSPGGSSSWTPQDVIAFVGDCVTAGGIRAVSFGGGEPLEYEGLFEILAALHGRVFRSLTTNGLLLHGRRFDELVEAKPDKVHVSIHFPDRVIEVERTIRLVGELAAQGIRSGVNLLVRRSDLASAARASDRLRESGIGLERIVYLPMRGQEGRETPTPREMASVVKADKFQSMTCLTGCAKSPRFCSIASDRTVAWCSYTPSRAVLGALTFRALEEALMDLALSYCGEPHERPVRLSRRSLHGRDLVRGGP